MSGHASSVRIAPSTSGASPSRKTPKTVGPDPVTRAVERAGGAEAVHPRGELRPQRHGSALEVVLERVRELGQRPAGELAHVLVVELGTCRPERIRLRVDLRRREPALVRDEQERHRRQLHRLHHLPRARHERVPRLHLARHVRAQACAERPQAGRVERLVRQLVGRAQDRRRVGAAATQPGGHRDPLVDRHPQRRKVVGRLGAEALDCRHREVRALDARAAHLVRVGRLDRQLVGQLDGREQGAELVQAVGALRADV